MCEGRSVALTESDAREKLGLLLRRFRERLGWKRVDLARETLLKERVIINLEHGVVNPARGEFIRIIKILALPAKEREKAYGLLREIFPEKSRTKFFLPAGALRARRGHGNYGRR
jgi:ribosome-binding protein aMBF1 (putative translation factor)